MAEDNDWAKFLSRAVYQSGKWQLENEFDVRRRAQIKIDAAIDRLFDSAKEAQLVFNNHLRNNEQGIQLLRITGVNQESLGFLLLFGRSQLKVERCLGGIQKSLLKRIGYETRILDVNKFVGRDDGLSCIEWETESNDLISESNLIKDFFVDLVKCEKC